ncbi:TPA: hypothetical protein ACPUE9_002495 [Proteus mirabilis]
MQGRAAFIYPCRTGCDGERLPEADRKKKNAVEKITTGIPGLSISYFALVKGFGVWGLGVGGGRLGS